MIQRCEDLRLACEPREPLRIRREQLRQDLQRDIAIEPGIARAEDLTHAAFAEFVDDFVRSEMVAGGNAHEVRDYRGVSQSRTLDSGPRTDFG